MIQIKDIAYSYGAHQVLKGVSFDVHTGDFVGILGNNGAGKSTLITCLNKIRTPKNGSVLIDGDDVMKMGRMETARYISYVGQKSELSQMTVFDSVLLGRRPYIHWTVSENDLRLCEEMLKRVGMWEFRLRYVNELSGGEFQKVMLARALVQQPKLLLLDEPTSSLDPKNQHEMLALIQQVIQRDKISALMVIHDLNLALRYCNKFVLFRDGRVYRFGDASVVTGESIFDVYGIHAAVGEINGKKMVAYS
ncbi:MAG: ABC transporter ATP-binding protein [Lawsonibacter sp.]|jgi:iron complex transport system ATP-binding protein